MSTKTIDVRFDSDDDVAVANVIRILTLFLPYMVDNVVVTAYEGKRLDSYSD